MFHSTVTLAQGMALLKKPGFRPGTRHLVDVIGYTEEALCFLPSHTLEPNCPMIVLDRIAISDGS